VSGSAAVACQLIRVTASIATVVWHIAPVHSRGARVAIGFARVAYGVGTFACFAGGGAQARGRVALAALQRRVCGVSGLSIPAIHLTISLR
jgi:hypothetical protein